MDGYITTVGNFIIQSSEQIITSLKSIYPMAEKSQVDSWRTLVDDVKRSNLLPSIPQDCVIAIEYSLPTDGMAADLILAGQEKGLPLLLSPSSGMTVGSTRMTFLLTGRMRENFIRRFRCQIIN